jgi:L-threonylcarbamoyladenylate synthase
LLCRRLSGENLSVKTVLTVSPEDAAAFICDGGLVAFPTETVYGLGGDVFDETVLAKIFEAKGRPADNPLIVHIANVDQIRLVAPRVTESAKKLIERFFPGPLTVVLEKSPAVPRLATAGLDTVGVRMPRNEAAQVFLAQCNRPVAAPSANISGRPSPTTWQAVFEDLNGKIECILRCDATEIGMESTVVDCTGREPVLLRPGAVSLAELQDIVPETRLLEIGEEMTIRSPGLVYRHYSPAATVHLVEIGNAVAGTAGAAYIGIHDREERFALKKICGSLESYAHDLFEFFRECDRHGIEKIFCEKVSTAGIGAALMDRLSRASRK